VHKPDISGLISEEDSCTLLLSMFPDCVILTSHMEIIDIGEQIRRSLNYNPKELRNKSVELISYKPVLKKTIEKELVHGCFDSVHVVIKGKKNLLECSLSGFYLGLIGELSNKILLRIKPRNQVALLHDQLEQSRDELDEFVYRTAHDLRGPVATVRGLITLMRMENPTSEMAKLVEMLDHQANKLNDRLYNLNYLSEFAFAPKAEHKLDCATLESKLRSTIEENTPIDNIDFEFFAPKRFVKGVDAELVISMINNLVLYLLNLTIEELPKLIVRVTQAKNDTINVTVNSEGFLADYQVQEAISQKTPLYTNVVVYSKLINFFAAQKAAQRMNATIKICFSAESRQQVFISIPNP
jgi:signal transduction histidine kinase